MAAIEFAVAEKLVGGGICKSDYAFGIHKNEGIAKRVEQQIALVARLLGFTLAKPGEFEDLGFHFFGEASVANFG